jgi:hypothetical protein
MQLWRGGIGFNPSSKKKTPPRDADDVTGEGATEKLDRQTSRWEMPAEMKIHVPKYAGEVERMIGEDVAKNVGDCYFLPDVLKEHLERKVPLMRKLPMVAQYPPVLAKLVTEGIIYKNVPEDFAKNVAMRKEKYFNPAILTANIPLYAARARLRSWASMQCSPVRCRTCTRGRVRLKE